MNSDEEKIIKLVLIGPPTVGKTCIVVRLMENIFSYDEKPTVGVTFVTHFQEVNGQKIRLQIWDTTGEEKFRAVAPMYYHDTNSALIVFAINNRDSFEQLDSWAQELNERADTKPLMFFVGNKNDLDSEREVSFAEANALAEKYNSPYFEVSALTGEGIENLFNYVARKSVETNHTRTLERMPVVKEKKCC